MLVDYCFELACNGYVFVEDEEGKEKKRTYLQWQADEEYMLTDATYEDIEANFDDYFYKAGPQPTVEERLDIVEGVIGEMMEG